MRVPAAYPFRSVKTESGDARRRRRAAVTAGDEIAKAGRLIEDCIPGFGLKRVERGLDVPPRGR